MFSPRSIATNCFYRWFKTTRNRRVCFFPDGAQTIAQKLAEELGNCIHLQTPVRSLEYDGQLVCLHSDRGEFYGKRVIFALPPQHFKTMDWTAEPFSCGGYASRRAIGEWINGQNTLAQPCEPIHFAGTETATEWRSYMEGALQSAERASTEVLKALNRCVEPLKTY
ncbi:MAG: hypothetical protein HC775_21655 [Hyellaceae cyanobacterium CSU_1_1]|nr:hypothetical protein [Hyellaceae cyanobacterium CSU_1_1]